MHLLFILFFFLSFAHALPLSSLRVPPVADALNARAPH
jgi:hypothetical protein